MRRKVRQPFALNEEFKLEELDSPAAPSSPPFIIRSRTTVTPRFDFQFPKFKVSWLKGGQIDARKFFIIISVVVRY